MKEGERQKPTLKEEIAGIIRNTGLQQDLRTEVGMSQRSVEAVSDGILVTLTLLKGPDTLRTDLEKLTKYAEESVTEANKTANEIPVRRVREFPVFNQRRKNELELAGRLVTELGAVAETKTDFRSAQIRTAGLLSQINLTVRGEEERVDAPLKERLKRIDNLSELTLSKYLRQHPDKKQQTTKTPSTPEPSSHQSKLTVKIDQLLDKIDQTLEEISKK